MKLDWSALGGWINCLYLLDDMQDLIYMYFRLSYLSSFVRCWVNEIIGCSMKWVMCIHWTRVMVYVIHRCCSEKFLSLFIIWYFFKNVYYMACIPKWAESEGHVTNHVISFAVTINRWRLRLLLDNAFASSLVPIKLIIRMNHLIPLFNSASFPYRATLGHAQYSVLGA